MVICLNLLTIKPLSCICLNLSIQLLKPVGICLVVLTLAISIPFVVDSLSKKLSSWSEKKETWISAERVRGFYHGCLDPYWVHFIFRDMDTKIKLKDSCSDDKDHLNLVYEIKAKLTRPQLSESSEYSEVDYAVEVTFKFIDEDGFIIHSTKSGWSIYEHEEYERNRLKYSWNNHKSETITVKARLMNVIESKIAGKIAKVIYVPEIVITDKKMKQ